MESTLLGIRGAEHLLTYTLLNNVNKPPTTTAEYLEI